VSEVTHFEGWRISLVKATFEAPDGTEFTRDVVRHPGAVAVVAVTDDRRVLLVRQYRGPVDRELLEIPAGTRDVEGEPPQETARRELSEEAGVRAGELRLLARVLNSPGFCD
jgi:ADP-ribose pyrophosphatase